VRVAFHHLAARELDEAAEYYESHRPGAADRFVQAAFRVVQRLRELPGVGRVVHTRRTGLQVRHVRIAPYPYGLIYAFDTTSETITVLAVAHGRRRPKYWRQRIG
jgi:plasmid stabilization system protein ParE